MKKYIFHNVDYTVSNGRVDLAKLVNRFISDIVSKTVKQARLLKHVPRFISVICQIRESDDLFFTIGNRFPIKVSDSTDVNNYIHYLENKLAIMDNNKYSPNRALSVYFNYCTIDVEDYQKSVNKINISNAIEENKQQFDFTSDAPMSLPLNTLYDVWGDVSKMVNSTTKRISQLTFDTANHLNRYVEVNFVNSTHRVIKIIASGSKQVLKTFTDSIYNSNSGEFVRIIGNTSYYILNEKVYFIFEKIFSKNHITKLTPNKKYNFNIMTLDIETYVDPNTNKMLIYCISMYDGDKAKSFYITDYENIDKLLQDFLSTLFSRKYTGKIVYIHNGSNFDLIFLLKHIVSHPNTRVSPIIKSGKFISLKVKFGKKLEYYVDFRDSLLLLNSSLAKLGKSFKVETLKDIFPHNFVSPDTLNYIGKVAAYSYFDPKKVTIEDYNEYTSRFSKGTWSLKNEAIRYCEHDCISLYQVLDTFSKQIYKKFKVNVSLCPTLPSLAFRIFRTHYLPKNIKIPVIDGKILNDIKQAYYGGHVDMYIPKNVDGKKTYHYDVNSLYPSAMEKNLYPTNLYAHFKGDISMMEEYSYLLGKKDTVGVFKVNVTTPMGLANPILPHKFNNGTIFPEGAWTGWYYSEEISNAIKYGYRFQILEGYIFDSEDIFSKYINEMYKMKESSSKDSPNYMTSKLLMNSLYGRFGMDDIKTCQELISTKNVSTFVSKIGIENLISTTEIGSKTLILYKKLFSDSPKINMSLAAAICANSRVAMSIFKNNPLFNLLYSDTDSAFIDAPLPDDMVDNKKLGKMKLEHIFTKFIALGPKIYGGIVDDGSDVLVCKGLKKAPSLEQMKSLMVEGASLDFVQEKWFNQLCNGTISVNDSPFTLKTNSNKRELVYDNGVLVGTKNIVFNAKK